jgi:hypothetical protein
VGFGASAAGDLPSTGLPRKKLTCAEFESTVSASEKKAYKPGAWGGVPPELQKVPPGGELCGADFRMSKSGATMMRSALFGKDLQTFYAPLFEAIGCKPLECELVKSKLGKVAAQQTHCTCRGNKKLGSVATDSGSEIALSLFNW